MITLCPKINNFASLKDYKPISYCNVIYKCITKTIGNLLKWVPSELIDEAQTTFILGQKN